MLKVLYNFLIILFYFPYCTIIFFRRFFNKEHKIKFKEKILIKEIRRPEGFLFWFHAASIGELNTIFPLVDFFLKQNTKYKFLITTVTLSSFYEFEKKYGNNNRTFHQFLPYDSKFLVENFFKNWEPDLISFVDSEIWPNFFLKIKSKNLPFVLLNARLTEKTFKRWKLIKNFATDLFSSVTTAISSNKETVNHLNYFNTKNIKYFGNIKFCSSLNYKNQDDRQLTLISKNKVWCAISTHPDEEIFCAKVHQILKKTYTNLVTIIIPRHIYRTKKIFLDLKKMGLSVQIKNENQNIDSSSEIILVNYYGSVTKYLSKFKQIFIGKSLLKKLKNDSGQNPIDAAKMGCHIFHGPYVSNFKEIYDYLETENISEKIDNYNILAKKLVKNFKLGSEINEHKRDRFNSYSSEILKKTIKEYETFIK